MDPMSIAALITAIIGAGVQYKASSDAQQRQREQIQSGLERQRQLQQESEKLATDQAKDFAPEVRKQNQDELAGEIEQNLIKPVSDATVIRNQQTATQGDVSSDYSTAKAQSDANVMKDAQQLARILGKTGSASRLRTNEALKMAETGLNIDRLSNFSRGNQAADAIAIQQAGQVDPGLTLAGSLMQSAGTAGLMYGGSGSTASAASTQNTVGDWMSKTGGGVGARGTVANSANFADQFASGVKIPKSFMW